MDLRGETLKSSDLNALSSQMASRYRVDRGTVRMRNKFSGGQKNELDTNYEIIQPLVSSDLEDFDNSITWSSKEEHQIAEYIDEHKLKQYAVMHIGARDEARRWPIERFAEIIDHVFDRYGLTCVLGGGPDDKDLNEACLQLTNTNAINAAGSLNLLEFAVLCSKSQAFHWKREWPIAYSILHRNTGSGVIWPGS